MKIAIIRSGNRLYPADAEAEEALQRIPAGKPLSAEITQQRNPLFHRKAFAMLRYAFDCWNPPECPAWKGQKIAKSFERFRHDITILAGYGRPVVSIKGDVRFEAESLSYAAMSAEDFEAWYSATIDVLLRVVFVGQDREAVEKQINEFMRFW